MGSWKIILGVKIILQAHYTDCRFNDYVTGLTIRRRPPLRSTEKGPPTYSRRADQLLNQ